MSSGVTQLNVSEAVRAARRAALCTLLGVLLSGPVAVAVVQTVTPQPPWQSAELFARSFHPLQSLPYLGGFALIGGLVWLLASLHALAGAALAVRTTMAIVVGAAFTALITLNYIVQSTFVPTLVRAYQPTDASLIAAFSMSNPTSLAWALEMWGWALLGVATWLVAPVFEGTRAAARAARASFVANGPISITGALWTMLDPGWLLRPIGLVVYTAWNVLLCAMMLFAWKALGPSTSKSALGRQHGSSALS